MAVPSEVALKIWHAGGGEHGGSGARVMEGKGKERKMKKGEGESTSK